MTNNYKYTGLNTKSGNDVLNETHDYFQSQGLSIIGEGYREIATNPTLFESYVDSLTQGVSADHLETMQALMRNSNRELLVESSTTGIAPVASLSMPVIRKLWPKFALKDAVKEEVATTPRFIVSYMKPYMFRGNEDGTEERVYLPNGMSENGALTAVGKKEYCSRTVVLTSTTSTYEIDFTSTATDDVITAATGSALVTATGSAVKVQPLDRDFLLVSVNDEKVNETLDISNNIIYEDEDSGVTVLIRVDLQNAKAKIAAIGITDALTLELYAPISSEYNEASWSISFDIDRVDIQIPTGQHLNAELPVEALHDMMALYQIDGTKETTDIMTNVFANKLDLEILQFLRESYEGQPGKIYNELPVADEYTVSFDVRPAPGFAGAPKAWREELKPQIDFLAQKIKNNTKLNTGTFVIVANPLDAMLISNIDWQFRGGQGANVDGVDIDYSIGTYVGANSYKIISSVNVAEGAMFIVFLPASDTQMTYKYYPYSFSVEQGYISPNRSRIPSIMMTKRHTMKSFLPAIGVVEILNNDGTGQFNQYVTTYAWTDTSGD